MNGRFALRRLAPAVVGAFILLIPAAASAQLRWGRPTVPSDGACFYRDADFRGEYFCIDAGRSLSEMPRDMNDEISSIRIYGRAEVFVYRDHRFSGRSSHFERDVHNLKRENWNDLISSIEVRAPRGYREHEAMTYERAREVVRRAYLSVLKREPDAGSRGYVDRVMRDHWTQADVERELRKSDEFRHRR